MTPEQILAAIQASPELQALVPDTQAIADRLSAGRTRLQQPYLIGDGTVSDVLGASGPGPVFCYTLMLAAQTQLPASPTPQQVDQQALVWQAWRRLSAGNLDIGLPGVREQITAMVGLLPGLTAQGAAAINALAEVPDPVDEIDVRRALWADDGTLKV